MQQPSSSVRQVCFVDMPFGRKASPNYIGEIDFDHIYREAIKPAVESLGLLCIRGDEEVSGGVIHRAMFQRLIASEFLVADLSISNANVFYELGVRHAVRPRTTICVFDSKCNLPFDLSLVRSIPYQTERGNLSSENAASLRDNLVERLSRALSEGGPPDSPIFQLVPGYTGFQANADFLASIRSALDQVGEVRLKIRYTANVGDAGDLEKVEQALGDLRTTDAGLAIELFNAYYRRCAWHKVLELFERMPVGAKELPQVRVRLAMALMRSSRVDEAVSLLETIPEGRKQNPEVLGMHGRILMEVSRRSDGAQSTAYLERASDCFVRAFQLSPTNTYLGVNALRALTRLSDETHVSTFKSLLPVVTFAAERARLLDSEDCWAVATLLELAVLLGNKTEAERTARWLCGDPHSGYAVEVVRSELHQYEGVLQDASLKEALSAALKLLDLQVNVHI